MAEREEQGRSDSILSELVTQGRRVARAGARRAETELREDAREATKGSLLLGASAWLGLTGLSALLLAGAMAMPRNPVRGVVVAGVGLLGGSLVLGVLGLRTMPRQPMSQTREAVREGVAVLKENLT